MDALLVAVSMRNPTATKFNVIGISVSSGLPTRIQPQLTNLYLCVHWRSLKMFTGDFGSLKG